MRHPRDRRRPFWYLLRPREVVRADVAEELKAHLEMRAEDLEGRGLSADAARREALRRFGDLERTKQYCEQEDAMKAQRVRRGLALADLVQDAKICVRGLVRAPALTATIVLTVGLGIGAATTLFAGINAAILRPLPYADADRLVRIYTDAPPQLYGFSVADYLALTAQATTFDGIAGYTGRTMSFSNGDNAERLQGRLVSWTYFGVLGIRPTLGRDFIQTDGQPGSPPAVIVSRAFWQQRLGSRPDVIGSAIRLDGVAHTLAGVLPASLGPLEIGQQFFVAAQWATPPRKGPFFITVVGHLRADVPAATAVSELRAINRQLFPIWQTSYQDDRASWNIRPLKAHVLGDVQATANLALTAVGLMWLIACANASNLLIARVTSRRRELAVRTALGASRGRIIRLLLAEGGMLAVGSATVGLALAWTGVGLLQQYGAEYLPRTQEIALDGSVLWLLAAVTAVSGLIFGVIPALHGASGPIDTSLGLLGRSSTGTATARRLRRVLVGSQFAIATPLLVVAGLLLASLTALGNVELGINSHNVLTGAIQLPAAPYGEPGRAEALWSELDRRVRAVPGVTEVTFSDSRPPNGASDFNNFDLEDSPTPPGQSQPVTPWVSVTPEYFRVLGLSLVEGRFLDDRDGRTDTYDAIVVDRAWAQRFFPRESAVGKRLKGGGCGVCPWTTVVGVVSEVKYAGLDQPDPGTVYTPMVGGRYRFLIVRTGVDPGTIVPTVRQTLRDLDSTLPFSSVATMDELVDESLRSPRSLSLLVGALASVALVLSVIGIYGVMAHHVQQHAKDMCIRMALGGRPADVVRLVVRQGMTVVSSGVVVGVVAALLLTRLIASLLFGVGATDLLTFAGVAALLLTVALIACLVPAIRAVRLQPASVLRTE